MSLIEVFLPHYSLPLSPQFLPWLGRGITVKVDIQTDFPLAQSRDQMVGNVYPVRGGFGARNGHMHIIIAATEKAKGCCRYGGYTTITVDSDGDIVGANQYAFHYFDDKVPMARCDGIDGVELTLRSL